MDFLLGLAIGMALSYIATRVVIWLTIKQIEREGIEIDQLIDKMKQKVESRVVQARLEEHQGVFYLYRIDTDEFIAQGRTQDEIETHTERRIPDLPVYVTQADESVLQRYHATKNLA